jgi:glycosyltransferase involved in cell wall biosynthesis
MPVPPRTYGGIERHLALLADDLVSRGHAVTLFATADSATSAALRAACDRGVADAMDRGEAFFYEHYLNASLSEALRDSAAFDLLHFHTGCAVVPLGLLSSAPVLHTVHSGLTLDDVWVLRRFPRAAVTALTRRQVDSVPDDRRRSIRVVPYGFDFDCCHCGGEPGSDLVFLGRMAPHKGPDDAIRIARAAGRPLTLAGAPVTPDDRRWFEREIEPQIDGTDIVWVGEVDEAGKDDLFRRARALVFPIKWDEPFGLVMLEALARGVPVLAYRRGSVPEVIEPGRTGWYADSIEALTALAKSAAALDRRGVRDRARQRFSHHRTTDAYLDVYGSLLESPVRRASR